MFDVPSLFSSAPLRLRGLLCHTSDSPELVSFTNALAIGDDGWAQLAPFGDFPGRAMLRQPDGSIKTFDAIQRLDRAAADGMTAKFKSPWHRVKRFITGCHIYAGHPDVPAFAGDYPDKSPKGMIVDLAVRDDGLYCKPVFTNEGSDLVETKKFRAFSGYWSAQRIGDESGKTIFRPDFLKSAGLTNRPNLPVHLMNENITSSSSSSSSSSSTGRASVPVSPDLSAPGSTRVPRVASGLRPDASGEPATNAPAPDETPAEPTLRKLIPWLAWHGVALPPEATAAQVEAALAQLDTRLEPAATVANAQPGRAGVPTSTDPSAQSSSGTPPSPSIQSPSPSSSSGHASVPASPDFNPEGIASSSPGLRDSESATLGKRAKDFSPSPLGGERAGVRGVSGSSSSSTPQQPIDALTQKLADAQTAFANERAARIETLLDLAIASGRITAAQRPDWSAKLGDEAQFANSFTALQQTAPALKTRALTLDMGARKVEIANAADRHEAVQNLVRAELPRQAGNYDRAFAAVRKANPALFQAMQQPRTAGL